MPRTRDVVVIGVGVVGAAISRLLAGYALDVVAIEARGDVGDGTSKANTAILHTGFDATPGTLESRLVHEGYHLLKAYSSQTGIPTETTSALLVAWDKEQLAALPALQDRAGRNGYHRTRIVNAAHIYATAPHLGPGALGGLVVPDESIICTWSTSIALATDAVTRGCDLQLDTTVTGIDVGEQVSVVRTNQGDINTRWVINAAGLGADTIERMVGYERFTLHPRRGELLVFDKLARPKVPVIVLPVPSKVGKGVLVSPTIYGNVMVGPTAEDMQDRADTATTERGLAFLREKSAHLMPALVEEELTAAYAGLRAAHDQDDYVVDADGETRYAVAGCIRSTGLTSAMAVAEHLRDLLEKAGLDLRPKADLPPPPRMPRLGEHQVRPYADPDLIAADPAYGTVVCFCERVTEGEIRDALTSTIPARDMGGLRRRTRAHNGRCQGFFCGARLAAAIARANGEAHGAVTPQVKTAYREVSP